jgi:hypothetical protein
MFMAGNTPLHKTVHWRNLKGLLADICRYEKIRLEDYDTNNIRCYRCFGNELKGKNVSYNTQHGYSCWANDNNYEIFEVPKRTNNSAYKFTGDFLVLAKNTSFDYWILTKLRVTVNSSMEESAYYIPYGQYTVATNGKDSVIRKNIQGRDVIFGGNSYISATFDVVSTRKKVYNFKSQNMIAYKNNFKNTPKNISGGDVVKIYKNNKKTNR